MVSVRVRVRVRVIFCVVCIYVVFFMLYFLNIIFSYCIYILDSEITLIMQTIDGTQETTKKLCSFNRWDGSHQTRDPASKTVQIISIVRIVTVTVK